jgi:hypothetical protein
MATAGLVLVRVFNVLDMVGDVALVDMTVVQTMQVAVVHVVGVILVGDRDVAAALTMGVVVLRVRAVLGG